MKSNFILDQIVRLHSVLLSREQNSVATGYCALLCQQHLVFPHGHEPAVTQPSTNQAKRCLTLLIGREALCSTWYDYGMRPLPSVVSSGR